MSEKLKPSLIFNNIKDLFGLSRAKLGLAGVKAIMPLLNMCFQVDPRAEGAGTRFLLNCLKYFLDEILQERNDWLSYII